MTHPAASVLWDAIIVGTGIGGGTLGRVLAEAGQKVLFVEQGPAGWRAEENGLSDTPLPEARLARGLWPSALDVTLDGVRFDSFAPLGAGVGGSSVFYAATLERPEPHDLDDTPQRPHPTGGWPVGFDRMRPFYDQAARLYEVYGTPDPLSDAPPLPLRAPPDLTEPETALFDSLRRAGLHPYHAHTALRREAGCATCLGRKCPRPCKRDGRSAGVEPALATGHATLLDRAEVVRIHGTGSRVSGLELRHGGETQHLTARRYVLSAGALGSARLVLESPSEAWPQGPGNGTGLVGRHLMFHLNEMFALWPPRGTAPGPATKAVSLRDFYHHAGARLGTVQAMGLRASYGEIAHFLRLMVARSALRHVPGAAGLTRLPAALAVRLFGQAQIFVGLLEDLPYAENRVTPAPDRPQGLAIRYSIQPELQARRRAFRRAIRSGLKGQRHLFLNALPELNLGHPCGTLRFGADPAQAVLRPDCRMHGIDNLWCVDASFMPTSMGVNPSLTIAANALRVGDHLLQEAFA